MRFRRALALAVLTAGLAVLVGDELATAANQPPAKLDKKAKRKALLAAKARAAEEAQRAEERAAAEAAKAKAAADAPATPAVVRDPAPLAKLIDDHISKKLTAANLTASSTCSDEEFLRRTFLDLTGTIPSVEQAKAFLDNTDPKKRAKLVDELLASSNYGKRQADVWYGLLIQRTSDNRRVDFSRVRTWLAGEFNKNQPWDKMVTALVTATGTMNDTGAVGFYLSNNTVDKMVDVCGKLFMGQQIQCAQCHNHPFTGTKQTEYWGMAAFFLKTQVGNVRAKGSEPGVKEMPAGVKRGKKGGLPESAKILPPKFPGPGGIEAKLASADPARPALAKWLTSANNPYFAKAMVNRTWAQLFGRGFVNPVDDMSPENTVSHPELLDALAKEFAANGFDLKHLTRAICISQAYQRSSKPTAANKNDHELFSHMTVKVMTPEQLYDSLAAVTKAGANERAGRAKNGVVRATPRDTFINFFLAGADTANTTEYEAGIPQALRLMNSSATGNQNTARAIVQSATKPEDAVERLYLTALSRRPTAAELKMLTEYVAKNGATPTTYSDILWAVLNSSEFTLVR